MLEGGLRRRHRGRGGRLLELADLPSRQARREDGLGSRGSNARAATAIGCASPPERCGSSPTARHLTLPVIGTVRTHENTRRIERLIRAGRARVLAISVRRNGTRLDASVRVLVQRPQQPSVALPGSRVGVDVGVRRLATVATADGVVIEHVENPRPLDAALRELRQRMPGTVALHERLAAVPCSAPCRFPGCTAGSTTSAPITCTS